MRKGLKQLTISKSITNRDLKSTSIYLRELNIVGTDPMSREEELRAFEEYKNGCKNAGDRIIKANLRFVVSVAKQYQTSNPTFQLSDLISLGNIGLIKALRKFNPDTGFKFISYAVWWIRQSIMEEIKDKENKIRLPQSQQKIYRAIQKCCSSYYSKYGIMPSDLQVALEIGVTEENVRDINNATFSKSLDAPVSQEDKASSLVDLLPCESTEFEDLFNDKGKSLVRKILKLCKLTEIEKTALLMYFGINTDAKGMDEIAKDVNRTTQGSREIIARAVRKLRKQTSEMSKSEVFG